MRERAPPLGVSRRAPEASRSLPLSAGGILTLFPRDFDRFAANLME